jgi:hypothetical protein
MIDFSNIEYLKTGNKKQQHCYTILKELNILSLLERYKPLVVGTIPIEIDIDNSDIDIVCNSADPYTIQKDMRYLFSGFGLTDGINGSVYTGNFFYNSIEIEVYAQNMPSNRQNGYIHMLVEYRILQLAGKKFKEKIIELKKQGYKTEPAFGVLLQMQDPFSGLLELEKTDDKQLKLYIEENIVSGIL